jgi:hypothetical protein
MSKRTVKLTLAGLLLAGWFSVSTAAAEVFVRVGLLALSWSESHPVPDRAMSGPADTIAGAVAFMSGYPVRGYIRRARPRFGCLHTGASSRHEVVTFSSLVTGVDRRNSASAVASSERRLAEPHDALPTERPTIPVIDDDVEMTEMLAEYLEPEGFAGEVRHDGEAGLKRAMQGGCLLVVLDVMLPRVNGLEAPFAWPRIGRGAIVSAGRVAVDAYERSGAPELARYLDSLSRDTGIRGTLSTLRARRWLAMASKRTGSGI